MNFIIIFFYFTFFFILQIFNTYGVTRYMLVIQSIIKAQNF
jgi:hypothetical protein